MIFETERLIVRHISRSDLNAMFAVYCDEEAMRWVDDGKPITWEDCTHWVDVSLKNYDTRGYGMSALVLRSDKTIAGFCGLVHPGGQAEPEIKYTLRREHWGKGLATEAVKGMLAYASGQLGINQIVATVDTEHAVSQRVLVKAGLRHAETRSDGAGSFEVYAWSADGTGRG